MPAQSARRIEEQLARILASSVFAQAPMLSRLLRYLVERSVVGQSSELKEYSVGVEAFERGPSFDPRTDPIVRVQARRLRSKLQDYYRGEGQSDPIVFDLPKGHYAIGWQIRREHAEVEALQSHGVPASADLPSIVVLPFANLSGDVRNEYFSDGLTEEIINALASVQGLRVVARTSAFQFKGRNEDIRKIGRELGVETALEGSIRKDGERIRATTQLINVSDGLHLWSRSYDCELTGVFAVQDEITRAIVEALKPRLAQRDRESLRSREPTSPEAHELYLKGRYFWHKTSPEDLEKCVRYMERAIALDPNYAAAHAGLADTYILWATMVQGGRPLELLPKARRAAQQALALADLAESHSAMGMVLAVADWNWADAEQELRRALTLKPSFAFARMAYAVTCLCPLRRHQEALEQLREALRTDPVSVFLRTVLGQTLILAGEPESAIDELHEAVELDARFIFAHVTLALAYLATGSYREALGVLQSLPVLASEYPNHAGHLGYTHARLGHQAEAEKALHDLLNSFAGSSVPGVDVAAIYNGLGKEDAALTWLERACDVRCFDSLFLIDDPRFRNLHSHPGFIALLSQMGLQRAMRAG